MGAKSIITRRGLIGLTIVALIGLAGCRILEAPPPTATPLIVTATPPYTDTPSATPTSVIAPLARTPTMPSFPTNTATPRPTTAPTLTPSFTPTFTESPAPTNDPANPQISLTCVGAPQGGFATVYGRDPALQAALGCAVSGAVAANGALQEFESGKMLWVSSLADIPGGVIYALVNGGAYQRFNDTWVEGADPALAPGGEGAPDGRIAPVRGFGKVWGLNPAVRGGLGWALAAEGGTGVQIQRFERGELIFIASLNQTCIVFTGPTGAVWRLDPTGF